MDSRWINRGRRAPACVLRVWVSYVVHIVSLEINHITPAGTGLMNTMKILRAVQHCSDLLRGLSTYSEFR